MRNLLALSLLATALSACAEAPAMLDMSQDRVIVLSNGSGRDAVQAEASRGCATYNRTPVYMSQACADQYCIQKRYLFACRAV